MNRKRVVIALGGNAIQTGDASAKAQQAAVEATAKRLVSIMKKGYEVVITHGNGPQVGNLLLQQKAADSAKNPAMPLDTCGAMSQGMIGYWMQNAIGKALVEEGMQKEIASVVTQVVVDPTSPAFLNPTKPIGPFYSENEAKDLMEQNKGIYKEDAGRGWRKVVPSPEPVQIIEINVIRQLVDNQMIVIAAGGGGIPVIHTADGLVGVEAVIDKDFAAQKLADLLDADVLMVLTAVDNVCIDYNRPTEIKLQDISVEELEDYKNRGHFAAGSMLPKVEAAIRFAKSKPGRTAIITSLEKAEEALEGKVGTRISISNMMPV